MDRVYNKEYYDNYSDASYDNSSSWQPVFERIADCIMADFQPNSVLDAGCAMGYLVAALRDRGVEAYGIDISEYAISKVREDIKPFCAVSSLGNTLPEQFPSKFDVVVTIEVLEHLDDKCGLRAIENICQWSDQVLFSSTPDGHFDSTHINVQQREYWAGAFARHGLFDDISYRPTYISQHAVYFKRFADMIRVIQNYEENIKLQEVRYQHQSEELREQVERVVARDKTISDHDETLRQQISLTQERDAKILEQIAMIQERDKAIIARDKTLREYDETLRRHIAMVQERDAKILEQTEMVQERDAKILEQTEMIQADKACIAQMQEQLDAGILAQIKRKMGR